MCSFDYRTYNYSIFSFLYENKVRIFDIKSYFKFLFYYFNPVNVVFIIVLFHVTKCSEMKFITISVFRGIAKRRIKISYFT